MRPKRLAPWLAVLGVLVCAGAARAQSQWSSDYFYYGLSARIRENLQISMIQ